MCFGRFARGHVVECPVCAEIIRISGWMQTLASSSEGTRPLPDAGLLWWKAQLSEGQTKTEKAQKVLDWAELIFVFLLCAGLGAWMARKWEIIKTPLASLSAFSSRLLSDPVSWALHAVSGLSLFGLVMLSLVVIGLAFPLLAWD
jgi:hypothetical protein